MLSFREAYSEKLKTKNTKNVLKKSIFWKSVIAQFESIPQALMIQL